MGYGANAKQLRDPIVQAAIEHDCHHVSLDKAEAHFALFSDATDFLAYVMGNGYTHVMIADDSGIQYIAHWES